MKVVTEENNKEIIYIQMNDLAFLNSTDEPIPASIYLKAFGQGTMLINDDNRFDYLEFISPKDVEYLKALDFIVNYNEYSDLSLEDIENEGIKTSNKINEIANKYNAMNTNDKIKNSKLLSEYEKLKFLLDNIGMLYMQKKNGEDFTLPKSYTKRR
jgi:hypothetical protein